jgi:hypothetical protein
MSVMPSQSEKSFLVGILESEWQWQWRGSAYSKTFAMVLAAVVLTQIQLMGEHLKDADPEIYEILQRVCASSSLAATV